MKWFKHYADAGENRNLNHLMDEFGPQGYAWWFLLLELCAEKSSGNVGEKFTFHPRTVRRKLRTTQTKVQQFLDSCQTKGQLTFNISPTEVELQIPKLFELRDDHSRRSVVTPLKNPLDKIRIDKDKNRIDKNIVQKTQLTEPSGPSPVAEIRDSFLQSYQKEFKRDYPGWGAKENGMASKWLKSVGIENAKRLCEIYPKWNDPWVTRQGHPLGVLVSQYVQLDAWAQSTPQLIQKIAAGKAAENRTLKIATDMEEAKLGLQHAAKQQQAFKDLCSPRHLQEPIPFTPKERILGESRDPFDAEIFDPPSENDFGKSM